MKRIFLARRNALLSSADFSWGAYALIAASLLLFARLIAPDLFWRAFAPVFESADSLSEKSHAFFSSFAETSALALENERLRDENVALALEKQSLLQNVNALSALIREPRDIIAGVVARPPESPYDTLVLASGIRDGVSIGMEVFGASGVPIGIITSVTDAFSRATLFSSSGVSTPGWVGENNVPLAIVGLGGGAMRATLPRSAAVAVGDIVFVPGPGLLPAGKVAQIEKGPSSPSMTLRISSAFNLFSASWVVVRDTGMSADTFLRAISTPP